MKWESQGKLADDIELLTEEDFEFDDGTLDREDLVSTLQEIDAVVIVIGEDNYDHPWLDWEGEFCHQWGINRRIMRIPYTDGYLPEPFTVLREIAYNPNAIEKELRDTVNNDLY